MQIKRLTLDWATYIACNKQKTPANAGVNFKVKLCEVIKSSSH